MFFEFFACGPQSSCRSVSAAWFGLVLVLAHAFLHGYIKWRLNHWYGGFYDTLQTSGTIAANSSATAQDWKAGSRAVSHELLEFCKIAAIAIGVMPLSKLIRSLWCLEWRLKLSKYYLSHWDPNMPAIEGASQRLQEDSYKFAKGIEVCVSVGLDAVISLVIFVPVLLELGERVKCPDSLDGFFIFGDAWLAAMAIISAFSGFVLTFILGSRLVGLEVENQKAESNFRTDLVILEVTPSKICNTHHVVDDLDEIPQVVLLPPAKHFSPLLNALKNNYRALFLNFFGLNLWLAAFDQFMVILPYLLAAPRLFDPNVEVRILLGTLVQVSNAYDKVFTAMNTISENWAAINEFRSVIVRLRQFELNIYKGIPHPTRTSTRSCLPNRSLPQEVVEVEIVEAEPVSRV